MNPITREESLLDGQDLTPITRKEKFIKRIYDKTQEVPTPITREEWFLNKAGEGGGGVTVKQLSVTENGTYSEPGKAYSPVIVEVPEPTLITKSITANGTYSASDDNADGYSQVTVAVEGYKKKSIANTPTDIASFNDGTANPMPSLEISIVPVQSGSGDPSPSNVRPISGWSGANVTRCGKNLFNPQSLVEAQPSRFAIAEDGSIATIDNLESGIVVWKNTTGYDGKFSVTYTYKYANVGTTGLRVVIIYKDGTTRPVYTISAQEYTTITYTSDKPVDCIKTDYGTMSNRTNFYLQVELGSTATAYSPYQGSTLSIPFHDSSDNPITVYGGWLNVTSGELRVTYGCVDLGTKNWSSSNYRFNTTTALSDALPGSHANCICSMYKSDVGAATRIADMSICLANNGYIYVYDTSFEGDANAFKQDRSGVQLVYELATPQAYQLTPAQVSTLLGQNNIFADCGQILEGEYFVTL